MTIKSKRKKFVKHIIKYNVLDYFIPRLRRLYKRLGILDVMDNCFYWIAWKLCNWAFTKGRLWSGDSTHEANVPQTGAGIFIANHSHALDPFISACRINRKVHWVSKIENYYLPFFRPILQSSGSIPIRRGESDQNAMRLIRKELSQGEFVGMFPEGTRTRNGYLGRFHTGAARLCLEFQIPYIPVGVVGSYKSKIGDKIDVHVGRARYPPKGMKDNYENAKWFAEQMRQDILRLSGAVPDPQYVKAKAVNAKVEEIPTAVSTPSITKMH
ncbi:hypothetical protein NEF87_000904 [Candidatus Lokiarchaeum ossiferum]|uniref:Phospholipid/glycerol acyltransferase domain-containing protein n=1 Tax=Candidatus Lokiarchaeum ossiferum TaxID=2951803 RepID=A0ABY6HM80_9ARCH|nr:hypothetical protein NEF87_000904 [Candidatus Lokiarchaeum sp. B-35]